MLLRYASADPTIRAEIAGKVQELTKDMVWIPNPGPQTEGFHCLAKQVFFGGQGGGSKSDLLCGTAMTQHKRSLLMRRRYADLSALTERCVQLNGTRNGYKDSSPPRLITQDGRRIDFGAAQRVGDEEFWQGRPHDFLGIDEVPQMAESQVRFLMGWVRTTDVGQRTRVILAGNAPISAEQRWVIGMFRPWLDLTYDRPAKHGEIRWFLMMPDGKEMEVPGPEPVTIDGKDFLPESRTFIPAALADNPFLTRTDYQRTLDALPEPVRSAVRDGNFAAAQTDIAYQVIPTQWIVEAEARWEKQGGRKHEMTAMSFDPAGGGIDAAVICHRHGPWVGELESVTGPETADGSAMAGRIIAKRRNNCPIVVDVGGGFGADTRQRLKDNDIEPVIRFNGAEEAGGQAKGSGLHFVNKRAWAYWKLREELDPEQSGGAVLALPPDPELRADLAAPTYEVTMKGIKIEKKEDIRKKLGRSPGKGDAVVMCVSEGQRAVLRAAGSGRRSSLKNNMGHDAARRRR